MTYRRRQSHTDSGHANFSIDLKYLLESLSSDKTFNRFEERTVIFSFPDDFLTSIMIKKVKRTSVLSEFLYH